MREHEWGSMNENEFESMLENSFPELPSDDIVAEVTPWRKAMDRVLTGLTLCTVTLNFLWLDHILPTVGMVLLLLGFRALRRENRWFLGCFIVTLIRAAYVFPMLILNATVFRSAVLTPSVTSALTTASLLLTLSEFFFLWRGLRAVQRKAGLPEQAGGAVALMVWYGIVYLLATVQLGGLILVGGMLVAYYLIIKSVFQLSKELDEAGYTIRTAPVRISDKSVARAVVGVLFVGCALGYLFGGSYPMAWSAVDPAEHAEVVEIKAHLVELGFPEYVLDDLTAEEIASCEGALRVVADVTDESVNDGRTVRTESFEGGVLYVHEERVYDVKELRITGVGVQVPGETERWIIFHHFLWTTDPGFRGTESIQLWPVYRDIREGWASAGEVTGRVLYDKNGLTLSSPYHSIGEETVTLDTIFWGRQTNRDVFATFSMPNKGERHRGYVAYQVEEERDGYIISSWVNYTHQRSWFQYPVMTAMEKRMANGWNDAGAFLTVQDALQFWPTEEDTEIIN